MFLIKETEVLSYENIYKLIFQFLDIVQTLVIKKAVSSKINYKQLQYVTDELTLALTVNKTKSDFMEV